MLTCNYGISEHATSCIQICDVSCGVPFGSVSACLLHFQRKVHPAQGETDCLNKQIRMFVLIWATLLFSVRGSNADTGMHLYCDLVMIPILKIWIKLLAVNFQDICSDKYLPDKFPNEKLQINFRVFCFSTLNLISIQLNSVILFSQSCWKRKLYKTKTLNVLSVWSSSLSSSFIKYRGVSKFRYPLSLCFSLCLH